jgi:hypothetical protein
MSYSSVNQRQHNANKVKYTVQTKRTAHNKAVALKRHEKGRALAAKRPVMPAEPPAARGESPYEREQRHEDHKAMLAEHGWVKANRSERRMRLRHQADIKVTPHVLL